MSPDAPPQNTPQRPSRAQRVMVALFLMAFGLTMLTVLFTGLAVRARRAHEPEVSSPAASGAAPEHRPDREEAPLPR